MRIPYIMPPSIFSYTGDRDAKCHGYDGYIRVKISAGCGKILGEHARFVHSMKDLWVYTSLIWYPFC